MVRLQLAANHDHKDHPVRLLSETLLNYNLTHNWFI